MFENDDYYTGPPLDSDMVQHAERRLGVRLPAAYVDLLAQQNGGVLRCRRFPTAFSTSWASDHFAVRALLGIGGDWGIDSQAGRGSPDQIKEWGYPDIGVVICDMPSGGHDAVMLDYSDCGPVGEPAVVYVDEDRVPRPVAASFAQFLARLEP
jgi:hypothetical protein